MTDREILKELLAYNADPRRPVIDEVINYALIRNRMNLEDYEIWLDVTTSYLKGDQFYHDTTKFLYTELNGQYDMTIKEIMEWLIDGNKIICKENGYIIKLNNSGNFARLVNDEYQELAYTPNLALFEKYEEPVWYDNIPEQGILCWVNGDLVAIITEFSHTISGVQYKRKNGMMYTIAKPFTYDELMQYFYNPDQF